MPNKNNYKSELVTTVIKEVAKVHEHISKLPFDKKPSWEKRAFREYKEVMANPVVSEPLADPRYVSDFKYRLALRTSLLVEYDLSSAALKMIDKFSRYNDPFSPGYIANIFVCSMRHKIVLPSSQPSSAFKRLGLDEVSNDAQKSTPDWFIFTKSSTGISANDMRDFVKYYMPVLKPLISRSRKSSKERIRGLDHLVSFRRVIELKLEGKSISEISGITQLDVKTVSELIKRANIDSYLGNMQENETGEIVFIPKTSPEYEAAMIIEKVGTLES